MKTNSNPNPGGCVVGFLGILSWLYMGICTYILVRTDDIKQDAEAAMILDKMLWHSIFAFVIGLILLIAGAKLSFGKDFTSHHYTGEGY